MWQVIYWKLTDDIVFTFERVLVSMLPVQLME